MRRQLCDRRVPAMAAAVRLRRVGAPACCRRAAGGGCHHVGEVGRGAVGQLAMSTQATRPSSQRAEAAGVLDAGGAPVGDGEPVPTGLGQLWSMGSMSTEARTR